MTILAGAWLWVSNVNADPALFSDATLCIQSVQIGRSTAEQQKLFGGNYYSGSPGVNIHLLLKLKDAALLPLGRDAISIDTFIDDTYQNLQNSQYGSYSGNQPVVAPDGSALIFNVVSPRGPSDEAERVFVRGKVRARLAHGDPRVESAKLPLVVTQGVMVGPFRTVLRSIADNGDNSVMLTLAIHGDTGRILKLRVLDADENGRMLSDSKQTRIQHNQSDSLGEFSSPGTAYFTIRGPLSNAVLIEYTVAERAELVSIPFEAQVDLGATKAGPIKPCASKTSVSTDGKAALPWPPPARLESKASLPPRREPFVPKVK